MNRYISILSCLFFISLSLNAQNNDTMSFQMLVRADDGTLAFEQAVGLRFQIIQGTSNGAVVYEEVQNEQTNVFGLLSLKVGSGTSSIGDFGAIDWSNGPYFLSTEVDVLGGTSYTLQKTTKLNSLPYSTNTVTAIFAETLDYENITNRPVTITNNQISTLGFITISQNTNLNTLESDVAVNSLKNGFPGFGTIAGTAFDIVWSQINEDAYYPTNVVGIGVDNGLDMSAASLLVDGGLRYGNTPQEQTEGQLYYNPAGDVGFLFYTNSIGETKSLGTGNIEFNTRQANVSTLNFDDNILIYEHLGAGETMTPGYDFGDNEIVLSSATPGINFNDTSSSASFPTADFKLSANDTFDMGENFFSIDYINTGTVPFKLEALAPSNSLFITNSGNVGIGTSLPTERAEVNGNVVSSFFVGAINGLTNIPMTGTASVQNTGSTTIGADTNNDNIGSVRMQLQNQDVLTLDSNGDVSIGNITASSKLTVDGSLKVNNLDTETLSLQAGFSVPITEETPPNFATIDVSNKPVFLLTPTANLSYFNIFGGVEGQETIFINGGNSNITFFAGSLLTPNNINVVLEPDETMTIITINGVNMVTEIVN